MSADPARVADTQAWLQKARLDLDAAEFELPNRKLLGDVLFHAQQAAEKALKAFLAWHDVPFRKTHEIDAVGRPCVALDSSLKEIVDRAAPLSEYAWVYRYPGEPRSPMLREAEDAIAIALAVYEAVLKRLPPESHPPI